MSKVLAAMSGGVDSTAAALLVTRQFGADCCAGAIMQLAAESPDDVRDASAAAASLDIPFFVFDLRDEFRRSVIDSFAASYMRGETPNPCVVCNKHIKFGKFIDLACEKGCDKIATGHYARLSYDGASRRFLLSKGRDAAKDQSYFLYTLTQDSLSHVLFPLGDMTKNEVREIAACSSFTNAAKRESQDICFVPNGDYAAFIEKTYLHKSKCGNFTDKAGNILGCHIGIEHYTTGQRRGLGISARTPLYVISKNTETNTVILGKNEDLFTANLTAHDINLIACDKITAPLRVKAKIRSRHTEAAATVEQISDDKIHVEFDVPQRAVTRGQSVVLYDGDVVVGGGIIE